MSAETIQCPVRANAESRPEAPALITLEKTWSWAELDELVGSTAAHLNEMARPGSRVAVQMPNSPELVALVLAALRTGHVLVLISTRLPAKAANERIEAIGAVEVEGNGLRLQTAGRRDQTMEGQPSSVLNPPSSLLPALPPIPLNRPSTIIFTSASTGAPKAVLHTVGNHIWSARGLAEIIPLEPNDRWLLNLPLYHVGGLAIVYRCALAGAAVALPGPEMSAGEAIQASGVTHTSLVATQLYRLLREGRTLSSLTLNTLRGVLLGGSAFSPGLLVAASERGLPIHTSYGLTEMASTVTMTSEGASRRDLETSGLPLPHRYLAIRDGEILVRGRTLFTGYVQGSQLLQLFDDQGWFATGDLGYLDEAGRLNVTGRKDNRFISGGENIQPEEIEAALNALSGVVQAVVVPVADDEFGQRPVAFVQIDGELDSQAICTSLETTLPRFKLPVAIYHWPALKDAKPSRTALLQEAERLQAK